MTVRELITILEDYGDYVDVQLVKTEHGLLETNGPCPCKTNITERFPVFHVEDTIMEEGYVSLITYG
tara:strand:+ start:637 stop:837 length:201 start_codon:yes stop_codon:yes gene_type:complete